MGKYIIFLVGLLMVSCYPVKDLVAIGNLRKKDVDYIENKGRFQSSYLLEKNFSNGYGAELSKEGSLILPLRTADFYDAETGELLFSYTAEDLKKIRGEIKKSKLGQGAFLLTDNGMIYVDKKERRRIEDSLRQANK